MNYLILLLSLIFIFSLNTQKLSATLQASDCIIVDSIKYKLNYYLMEEYLKRPNVGYPKTRHSNSACRRGYVATLEIKDSLLILNDFTVYDPEKHSWGKSMKEYFIKDNDLVIDWFTGSLVLSSEDEISIPGFRQSENLIYRKRLVLEIINGKLISKELVSRDELIKRETEKLKNEMKISFYYPDYSVADEFNIIYLDTLNCFYVYAYNYANGVTEINLYSYFYSLPKKYRLSEFIPESDIIINRKEEKLQIGRKNESNLLLEIDISDYIRKK